MQSIITAVSADEVGRPRAPFGEDISESLATSHHPDQVQNSADVAPFQRKTTGDGFVDDSLFVTFHGPADRGSGGVHVQAKLIAEHTSHHHEGRFFDSQSAL